MQTWENSIFAPMVDVNKVVISSSQVGVSLNGIGCCCGYYRPQRSWAEVIFSQACVCPQGGGVSASVHAGIPPGADPSPPTRHTPPPRADPTPGSRHNPGSGTPPEQTPPSLGSRLQHTVNERPVRILLECILVSICF